MSEIPKTPDGTSWSDTEPKSLEVKNLNIQGIYGVIPGDEDPDFCARELPLVSPPSRAFDYLDNTKFEPNPRR